MSPKTSRFFIIFLAIELAVLWVPSPAEAAPRTLWQIGTFDDSSFEFHGKIDYTQPSTDLIYVIGKSDPAKDWVAVQPASHDTEAGSRPHPFTIEFDLRDVPPGLYSMRIALLIRSLRVPWLQVDVNGHRGWFYQHAHLTYALGAADSAQMPTSASSTIRFDIPANFLLKGKNKLILTVLDEPSPPTDPTYKSYHYGESRIEYDALAMEYDPAAESSPHEVTVDADPTVFYKRAGDQLLEELDVFVRLGIHPDCPGVTLILGNQKYAQKLEPGRDFGEYLLKVDVSEFSPGTRGELVLCDKGHSRPLQTDPLTPAKKWSLLMVPFSHLDLGYTDYQAKTAEVHARILDDVIQTIHARPDFRFCPDGFWIFEQFLHNRTTEDQEQLLQLVKENKITIPAQYANILTGAASLETLIRSFYPSHRFAAKNDVALTYATITDVPTYSWSYASILAAAGLKYFIAGADDYRAPNLYFGHLHEKSPFWWEGPDGGRVMMWYSRIYSQIEEVFGLPPQVAIGRDALPLFLQNYDSPTYKPSSVIIYGTQGDNVGFFPQQISMVDDWNKEFAYPRIQFSTVQEAMEKIATESSGSIPVVRGDGGPYWEDGVASDSFYTAMDRATEARALSAEKLATVSSLVNPRVRLEPGSFRALWENVLLYDEHTYGIRGLGSFPDSQQHIRQQAVKENFAIEGKHLLEHLLLRAEGAIEDYIPTQEGTLVVFNPLNWARSGLVDVDINNGKELWDLIKNQPVRFEVLTRGESFRHIRFLAADVPAMGYKCYALRAAGPFPPVAPAKVGTTIESAYYRLTLDPESGAVRSIFDKDLKRELVDATSPFRFNQYLYVTGADQHPNSLTGSAINMPPPALEIHGAQGGKLKSVTQTPYGMVARLESSDLNTPLIETEVILFDSEKKIEFINRVQKDKVYKKEAVYFAFPFAMAHPQFKYEIQNGFVNPAVDQMPGAGKEWFSVQHWVSAEDKNVSVAVVPVDAPLVALGDVVRGVWPRQFEERKATVLSYVMNNYWPTNYIGAQGGEFTFRYVVTSADSATPGALSRFGLEQTTPLESNELSDVDKVVDLPRPLNMAEGSFLTIDQPGIAVITWKQAEDGNGTILRLLEIDGKSSKVTIHTPLLNLESAWSSSALEENQQPLEVSTHGVQTDIGPFQILTLRLKGVPAMTLGSRQ